MKGVRRASSVSLLLSQHHEPRRKAFDPAARPMPPGEPKQKEVRYFHNHEDDQFDEAQFAAWVKQASQLPGERM